MGISRIGSLLSGLTAAAAALLLDQLSKTAMIEHLDLPHVSPLELTPFFNLVMVWNTGISFGMFAASHKPLILVGVSAAVTLILLVWLAKNTSSLVACALGLVMGGAIGNVIDRWRFGAVADFIDVHVGNYHWPAFNIADSCIFIGVVLLCAHSMFTSDSSKTKGTAL